MADKIYYDGINFPGRYTDRSQGYFCRAFAATCPYFEDTGLCKRGDCIHADENIPSADEMLRLQLLEIRRTQDEIAVALCRNMDMALSYQPKKTR